MERRYAPCFIWLFRQRVSNVVAVWIGQKPMHDNVREGSSQHHIKIAVRSTPFRDLALCLSVSCLRLFLLRFPRFGLSALFIAKIIAIIQPNRIRNLPLLDGFIVIEFWPSTESLGLNCFLWLPLFCSRKRLLNLQSGFEGCVFLFSLFTLSYQILGGVFTRYRLEALLAFSGRFPVIKLYFFLRYFRFRVRRFLGRNALFFDFSFRFFRNFRLWLFRSRFLQFAVFF